MSCTCFFLKGTQAQYKEDLGMQREGGLHPWYFRKMLHTVQQASVITSISLYFGRHVYWLRWP